MSCSRGLLLDFDHLIAWDQFLWVGENKLAQDVKLVPEGFDLGQPGEDQFEKLEFGLIRL
jgi:hypothetical protein